ASSLVFACGLFGILGGKVYYAILVQDWRMIFDRAGIVWYGGFLAGTLAFFWIMRRRRLPYPQTLDAGGPALALGYAVGRVGCFLVGDDYGIPTDKPWGVAFENGLPPSTAANLRYQFGVDVPPHIADGQLLAVHPTQLYTTAASLAIFGASLWLAKRVRLRPGALFLVVVMALSVERFLVEFLRAKDDRFFDDTFTVAQLISVLIFVVCIVAAWRRGLVEPDAPA
ncbi:MAG: prolipoprotein diacylglyceryl transferase, partial [Acidobacteriota bacterium]